MHPGLDRNVQEMSFPLKLVPRPKLRRSRYLYLSLLPTRFREAYPGPPTLDLLACGCVVILEIAQEDSGLGPAACWRWLWRAVIWSGRKSAQECYLLSRSTGSQPNGGAWNEGQSRGPSEVLCLRPVLTGPSQWHTYAPAPGYNPLNSLTNTLSKVTMYAVFEFCQVVSQ